MKLDTRTKLFLVLAAAFVTCLLVGDIIGGKLYSFRLGGVDFYVSAGMIPFPVVFLLTDILNEFYGKRAARFVTLVGAAMALLTIGVFQVAGAMPWSPMLLDAGNKEMFTPDAWTRIFSNSTSILLFSVIAYLISQLLDIFVFNLLKRASKNRLLWLRATGSTVVSQAIDTLVINFLYFSGKLPTSAILRTIATAYAIKLFVAIALTPLIYAGHAVVERVLGLHPVRLGPDGEPIEPSDKLAA